MVRGRLIAGAALLTAILTLSACRENRPMADQVDMPEADSTMMSDMIRADSMLDTMPGGEMVRGSDSATTRLLKKKM